MNGRFIAKKRRVFPRIAWTGGGGLKSLSGHPGGIKTGRNSTYSPDTIQGSGEPLSHHRHPGPSKHQLRSNGVLIEYAGRMDDPVYAAGMAHKEAVNRENGLAAIVVTSDWFRVDWPGRILGNIEDILSSRLAGFQASREAAAHVGASDRPAYPSRQR